MKKLLFIFLVLGGLLYAIPTVQPVRADEATKRELRILAKKVRAEDARREALRQYRARVERVRQFLAARNSPMVEAAESFIGCGERHGVSYKLLLALANKESSLGRFTPKYAGVESWNAFGWGIHQGRTFDSWGDGVCVVAKGLAENYDHRNIRATIFKYAPPVENNTELYVSQVEAFIRSI